jgi:hypothetical protein
MPHFQSASVGRVASRDWAAANRETFIGAAMQAVMSQISKHVQEQEDKTRQAG